MRLAADAVSYFTIRGLASEPLRVVLLLDRVPAAASTASTILERTAMGVMSVILVAITSIAAMTSDVVPEDWQRRLPRHCHRRGRGRAADARSF